MSNADVMSTMATTSTMYIVLFVYFISFKYHIIQIFTSSNRGNMCFQVQFVVTNYNQFVVNLLILDCFKTHFKNGFFKNIYLSRAAQLPKN